MELVTKVLNSLNLNFSKQTMHEVYEFLENEIGAIPKQEEEYYICAAAAIVSECQIIPTLDKKSTVISGIHIQNVMKNLPGLSKQRFLEVVVKQIKKWSKTPIWLLPKIDAISIAYRIFKKYQTVFFNLCLELKITNSQAGNLLSFLWVVQLFVRQKQKDPTNIPQNTILIIVLLRTTFTVLLGNLSIIKVDQTIAGNFQEIGTISDKINKDYHDQIVQQILSIYRKRYEDGKLSVRQILKNQALVERLLDDISNLYSQLCSRLPKMIVNQMTFLNISKNLTPLHIVHKLNNEKTMDKMLNFEDEDEGQQKIAQQINNNDENQQINPQFELISFPSFSTFKPIEPKVNTNHFPLMSPFIPASLPVSTVVTATPVSLKLQNMGWIKECSDTLTQYDQKKIEEAFEIFQKNQSYKKFRQNCLNRIRLLIEQFNKHCFNIQNRQNEIYTLFLYVLKKIIQSHSDQQNIKIFSKLESLRAILCLSVELFDFSYQSLTGQFRKYCELLDIEIIEAFKPINWIGRFLKLPKGLQTHLYNLQKQILIRQIWNDETGFKIITSKNNSYVDTAVMRRLQRHITERIEQICKQVGIELKYITKMNSLIKKIMENKPYLLKNNKIDQIILCSVTFYIRQNLSFTDNTTLADIFDLYNKTSLSYNSIKDGMKSPLGEQVNLLTFYNEVFLQEVQQISKEDDSLLGTPIRLDMRKKAERGLIATPIPIKFADKSTIPSFTTKSLSGKQRKNSYLKTIANSLKNFNNQEDQMQDNDSQMKESPRFGFSTDLERKFSFAKKK